MTIWIMSRLELYFVLIRDSIQAEYALGSLSNKIFASKYTLYIPDRELLEEQVERVLNNYKEK